MTNAATTLRERFSWLLFLLLTIDWIILSLLFSVPTAEIGVKTWFGLPFTALGRGMRGGGTSISWGGLILDLLIVVLVTFLLTPRSSDARSGSFSWRDLLHRSYLYSGMLALWGVLSMVYATNGMVVDGANRIGVPMTVVTDYIGYPLGALVHIVSWPAFLVDMLCVIVVAEGVRLLVARKR